MEQRERSLPRDLGGGWRKLYGLLTPMVTPGLALATSGLRTGWEQPHPPGTSVPTSPLPLSVQIG